MPDTFRKYWGRAVAASPRKLAIAPAQPRALARATDGGDTIGRAKKASSHLHASRKCPRVTQNHVRAPARRSP